MTTTPAVSTSTAPTANPPGKPSGDAALLVADHVAGTLLVLALSEGSGSPGTHGKGVEAREVARLTGCHVSEHAGFLALPDGRVACVDERAGEVLLLNPLAALTGRPMPVSRVSVAVPAEQVAADPEGRYLVVGAGLGLNEEPWNDLVTVVNTTSGRGVRVRTRPDEPGVGVIGGEHFPDGAPRLVLRRRAPGSLDLHRLDDLWTAPTGSPRVEPIHRIPLPDDGLGDADDPSDPTVARVLTACGDGVHRARVLGDRLVAEPPLAWGTTGRGHYLRPEPGTDRVWSVVRGGPAEPTAWPEWTNTAWCRHTAAERTDLFDLGPGLVFRIAFAAPGVAAFSRVHPDGDELLLLPTRPS
ncbi:hypothetical protein, partial [Streptomyces alkaliphilus]|uniref:hypothetical protein n=1 Tax=Streptomyces alkaliphilus TaxID=1472722 RepID=UPI00117F64BA